MNKFSKVISFLIFNLLIVSGLLQAQVDIPQEFFLDDWQPKTITSPDYINTPQPVDPTNVTITVDLKGYNYQSK
jgi:hypothetical protein